MADLIPNIRIITLYENGLNTPIKREKLADWITDHSALNREMTHGPCYKLSIRNSPQI